MGSPSGHEFLEKVGLLFFFNRCSGELEHSELLSMFKQVVNLVHDQHVIASSHPLVKQFVQVAEAGVAHLLRGLAKLTQGLEGDKLIVVFLDQTGILQFLYLIFNQILLPKRRQRNDKLGLYRRGE